MPEEIEARLRRQEAIGVAACSLALDAAFLGSSKARVAKLLQAGEIEGNRLGYCNCWAVDIPSLRAYKERQP